MFVELRASIYRESPFLKRVGHFIPTFQVEEDVSFPNNHLYTVR